MECETGEIDTWVHCAECNRNFKNPVCYTNHKTKLIKGKTVCKSFYRCKTCDAYVSEAMTAKRGKHVCTQYYCSTCNMMVEFNHQCFIKVIRDLAKKNRPGLTESNICMFMDEENDGMFDDGTGDEYEEAEPVSKHKKHARKKQQSPLKYIFFDFECTQDGGIHKPNLCVAEMVCEECAEKQHEFHCKFCTPRKVFKGENTQTEFCSWLFQSPQTENSVAIAHNMKSYDGIFLLEYLFANACVPKVVYSGAKVMSIEIPQYKRKIIDSLNFFPMALSKLPVTFGLMELKKGYFPHLFNTKHNQNYEGPLPDAKYYAPDGMNSEKRTEFYDWYETEKAKEQPFNLQRELLDYCISDVDILQRCCVQFRKLFMKVTSIGPDDPGEDPFKFSITIASSCNRIFRKLYMTENTIAVLPPKGYTLSDKQSNKALTWLRWVGRHEGVHIQHALNKGEIKIGKYKVDGVSKEGHTVYEFNGCLCLH